MMILCNFCYHDHNGGQKANNQLAWVNVVASAITKGTFTNRASVFASNVFPGTIQLSVRNKLGSLLEDNKPSRIKK